MPKKSLEQKLADLEREEESKVKRRRQRKYDERLEKGKQKAERKADEVERKVRLTYKKKKEKLVRLSKWLKAKTPAQEREEYKKKLRRQTSRNFSYSIRISRAKFSTHSFAPWCWWFFTSCYTCWDTCLVCRWDNEKKKRLWDWSLQNGHMIQKWSWNWLKFYRQICRPQCKGCNVYTIQDQAKWSELVKEEIGEEEHAKAERAKWPKTWTIEEIEKVNEESKAIIQQKIKESEKYINIT